jgi:hypothetical protein
MVRDAAIAFRFAWTPRRQGRSVTRRGPLICHEGFHDRKRELVAASPSGGQGGQVWRRLVESTHRLSAWPHMAWMYRINELAMDLSKSPALSRCTLPYWSRQVMVKGRSTGVHRVAALQFLTVILRLIDWSRAVGETVTGRAGVRISRPWSGLLIVKTVEVTAPDRRTALSTCSALTSDPQPRGYVRGGAAAKSMSSTACSSTRKGSGAGRACHHTTAPAPTATPSTKARNATACRRHWAGSCWTNGGREGPNSSVSVGCCAV